MIQRNDTWEIWLGLNGNTACAYQAQPVEHDYYRLSDWQGGLKHCKRHAAPNAASDPPVKTLPRHHLNWPINPTQQRTTSLWNSKWLIIPVEIHSHKIHSNRDQWKCQKRKKKRACLFKCVCDGHLCLFHYWSVLSVSRAAGRLGS